MLLAIEKLLILQDRDRKIIRVKEELAFIDPERKSLLLKAAQTQGGLDAAKLRVKQLESERKTLELEVEALKAKIEKYSVQQFQTKKNEEFQMLGKEITVAKAGIFKIEDKEIELMEKMEGAQKEMAEAAKIAAEAKKAVDGQIGQLAAREENLKKELAELTSNREQLAAEVDEVARSRYDRLLKTKGGNVLVGIAHGVCGGCHMKFPTQIVVACKRHEEIMSCPNCSRILYFTPDMDMTLGE